VAVSGVEAMKIMADRQVDLLLTDIMMPGMNGFDLADKAMLMRPGLRVVYMTGYPPAAWRLSTAAAERRTSRSRGPPSSVNWVTA
jgi:CheY-like chemotaxis protein